MKQEMSNMSINIQLNCGYLTIKRYSVIYYVLVSSLV